MKKVMLAAAAACCLAAAPASAQTPQGYQPAPRPAAEREKPAVKVREQAGSPMEVRVETKWVSEDQQGLELYLVVTNAGQRPVRAYTVRVGGVVEGERGGGCFFHNTEKKGKILQPGRARGQSTWRAVPLSVEHPEIDVALDFVEFDGGGTWGVDTCQSAEFLEGARAGGRVARREFRRRLDDFGLDTLLRQLDDEDPALAPPEGRSEVWTRGFHAGVGGIRLRLRRADEEGGGPEVEEALRRPVDASEDQQ
jgi:hypothetical protein